MSSHLIIQADYDELERVAQIFAERAQVIEQTAAEVERAYAALRDGGWTGQAAERFFGEMGDEVLPATRRLSVGLGEAETVTLNIRRIIQAAEIEAAALFREDGVTPPADKGKGFLGHVGDFFSGMGAEAVDTVSGIGTAILHPVETAKGLWYGITHPGEMWEAIKQPYVEDWNNGRPWRAIGRGSLAVIATVVGAKGLDKAAKAIRGSAAVDDVVRAGSLTDEAGGLGAAVDDVGRVGSAADDTARIINNTGRALSEAERVVADLLVSEGRVVEVVAEGAKRTPDFLVDGIPTELKTITNLTSNDLSGALSRRIREGAGQASHIIIDGRGQAGLTQELAELAIRRTYGGDTLNRIREIRIIGSDFDITVPLILP